MRALTKYEKAMLVKFRSLLESSEQLEISSLKSMDKRKQKEKVRTVKGVMFNVIRDDMTVTEVNRVLLVGGYLVAEGLGKVKNEKGKNFEKKGKPYWQRRVEREYSRVAERPRQS